MDIITKGLKDGSIRVIKKAEDLFTKKDINKIVKEAMKYQKERRCINWY